MKVLFDENISYRIVKKLTHLFPECLHISRSGLSMPASDIDIWKYAKQNDFMITTFDEDFEDLANLYGFPPKIIILRLGNASTNTVVSTLSAKIKEIETFYLSDTYGLLEIY
ncbi:MAG: DUF5615 family PIN-like protein [Spirosomataceae bacterium]